MDVQHACHCSCRIRYHMVFVLKYRKNLISDEIFEFLKEICKGIEQRYFIKFDALGSDGDHLHLVIEAAPRYAPSNVMQICKSILAKQVFKQFPEVREELWNGEFWSDGGHIDTVGDGRGLDAVRQYVEKQGKKSDQLTLYSFV
ncbi:MAG: IS200/IS605 family transposase [Nanoarchaeota archaeon]